MKLDPTNQKGRYLNWKESVKGGIPEVSKENSKIILDYVFDMELGLNVASASRKGARSYNRLNNLKQKIIFMAKEFKKRCGVDDLSKLTERHVHQYFGGMRNGTITRIDGKPYQAPADYVKSFKAFWHWHQKVNRKKGIIIEDITLDLDTRREKPRWVYLSEDQVMKLAESVKFRYKVLIMFLFDSGVRAPSELMNIKVSDFHNDFKEVIVRDEVSKTFG